MRKLFFAILYLFVSNVYSMNFSAEQFGAFWTTKAYYKMSEHYSDHYNSLKMFIMMEPGYQSLILINADKKSQWMIQYWAWTGLTGKIRSTSPPTGAGRINYPKGNIIQWKEFKSSDFGYESYRDKVGSASSAFGRFDDLDYGHRRVEYEYWLNVILEKGWLLGKKSDPAEEKKVAVRVKELYESLVFPGMDKIDAQFAPVFFQWLVKHAGPVKGIDMDKVQPVKWVNLKKAIPNKENSRRTQPGK